MLSQSGIHAVRAMVALASMPPDQYRGAADIAQSTGSPRNYTGKLLLQLARHGLVESRKGLGGGFRLAQPAHTIRLYDVMGAIEDISRWTTCALMLDTCSDTTPGIVHDRWERARDAFLAFLKDTTIAELAINHQSPKSETTSACDIRPALKQS